ncbi:hypothetical protein VTK26DRAFT_5047 [Humicola hyalothermophila]
MGDAAESLPYWQVNVPEHLRTAECPEFLRDIGVKDQAIIGTPDSEYELDSWEKVRQRVAKNELYEFRRIPSELRAYRRFKWELGQMYGSVMNFILTQRLHWTLPLVPKGRPFEFEDDYKILRNDWPYGIDKRIIHLVVWTKFTLEEDKATKDLTDEARAEIEAFVRRKFSRMPPDHVVWFKNWSSIQSVQSVQHFHVMLYDPDPEFVREITNGDIPLCEKS